MTTTAPPPAGVYAPEPWLSDLWLNTWWEHFGRAGRRCTFDLPPWGEPLPLLCERRYGLRRLRALGGASQRLALRCPAADLGHAVPALAAALARRRDWDWLELDRLLLPQARTLAQALAGAGLRADCAAAVWQRFIPLDRPWARIAACWQPSMVRQLAAKERALRRLGSLELETVTAPVPAAARFEECLRLEAAGWKGREGTAMLSVPAKAAFYRALVPRLAAAGCLRLNLLLLNQRLLAFACNTLQDGVEAGIKTGYDESPAWRRLSPGNILKLLVLTRAHAEGLVEYDLLGGEDAYKADWTPHFRELARLRAFNLTGRARAAVLVLQCRRRSRHHGACGSPAPSAPSSF